MEGAVAAIVAVLGTLAGAYVNHFSQQRRGERQEQFARQEWLRQQRLTVYSSFVGTVLSFRSAQAGRCRLRLAGGDAAEQQKLREESYRLRAATWDTLYQAKMLAMDHELTELADAAVELVKTLHDAQDMEVLTVQHRAAREAVERFITAAGLQVRP